MVVVFGLSFLFIIMCLVLGSYFSGWVFKWFKCDQKPVSPFLDFLMGFVLIGTFCNFWSLFLPVNQYAFITLVAASLLACFNAGVQFAFRQFIQKVKCICHPKMLLWPVPVLLVWFVFAVIAPQHGDSPGYHYAGIRWIVEYKVIPGLANLQGRFGFNSSFFTASAAFTLPGLTGQPIYPLNIAFSLAIFGWLLYKIVTCQKTVGSLIYVLVTLLMIRGIILTISSPTPDIIANIIMFYVLMPPKFPEGGLYHFSDRFNNGYKISISLLIVFAITVKLSCLFLLPVILLFFTKNPFKEKRVLIFVIAGSLIILAPWLARNYILTGYFIYPLSFTGFLHPDWKVPFAILHLDKLLINNGPKLIGSDWEAVNSLPFIQWFPLWVKANFTNGLAVSFGLLVMSLLSLITALVISIKKKHYRFMFLLLINLAAVVLWIINSPDYRFAYGYLVAGIAISGLYLTKASQFKPWLFKISLVFFLLGCGYYLHYGSKFFNDYSICKYWLMPVPPVEHSRHNDLSTFPFIKMKPGFKLYIEDSAHDCNNAPLPCFGIFFQALKPEWIEARGDRIADGFRMQKGKLD